MNEITRFINKEMQKKWLEIFMIINEINKKEDIISFSYDKDYLIVQTGLKDYYRISLKEVE